VLVFTNGNHQTAASQLVAQAKSNLQNQIPTIIIDPTHGSGNFSLEKALIQSDIELLMLLSYSNWNTAGNAMGIALANGIGRYLYLKNSPSVTQESHEGFIKAMTFSYLKDISYKLYKFPISNPNASGTGSYKQLLGKINSSRLIAGLSPYATTSHGGVSCSDYRYPWNRDFEMTFDINVSETWDNIYKPGDVTGDGKINVTDYILIRLHILGITQIEGQALAAADVAQNGKIDALDYIAVRLHILGITLIEW
jgi:hypothetical protein